MESFAETRGKLLASRAATYQMGHWLKSTKASTIALGVLALLVAWIGFQLGTHRHTGISAPAAKQHSVNLSWKASTSAVVGYNVYRRGTSGLVKLNSVPVAGTSYVDSTVQPGQTYYYMTKAVNAKGTESTASNEIRADIPSP